MEGLQVKLKKNKRVSVAFEDDRVWIQFKKLVDKEILKEFPPPPFNHLFYVEKNVSYTELRITREAAEALYALLDGLLWGNKYSNFIPIKETK